MSFEPRNLLVTGGAGFIGANFVEHWLGHSSEGAVVVLDALTYAGNVHSLDRAQKDSRLVFVRGDICDRGLVAQLLREHGIDTLVHFAAESHVDRSILGPDEFIRTNVIGTHTLLACAKAFWIDEGKARAHRFHHVSTDEVYGSLAPQDAAFHEATPYAPNSPYSASKAGSDHLVRAYHETYGLSTTVTNCSNNYGPYQFPEKLIPLVLINCLHGRPLPIYGDGNQVRDWLHVADHVRAIELALRHGAPGEVYNIGGDGETRNLELVHALCAIMDSAFERETALRSRFSEAPGAQGRSAAELITHVRDRPGHDRRYAIDFRKAQSALGYTPQYDLRRGLAQTVQWYLENGDWWLPLMSRDYDEWVRSNYAARGESARTEQ